MENLTYEEALSKLEKIVTSLEEGSLPLDKSMELFEEGTKLSAYCEKCLSEAEQKIIQLKDIKTED